jgi:hypothetical protein
MMPSMVRIVAWYAAVAALFAAGIPLRAGDVPRYARVSVVLGQGDLMRLGAAGIPLEESIRRHPDQIELMLVTADVTRLRGLGFSIAVLDPMSPGRAERARRDAGSVPHLPPSPSRIFISDRWRF